MALNASRTLAISKKSVRRQPEPERRALVTGASGRIGSVLIGRLLDKGYAVRALVRDAESAETMPQGIEVAFGNITDAESLKGCCEKVDVVFHLAASIDYLASREELQAVNGRGTLNIVGEASRAGVSRFIYASSIAVYGKRERGRLIREEEVLNPTDKYGASKRAGENAVRHGSIPFVLLRFGMIYGPGFDEAYLALLKMLEGHKMPYIGDAQNNIPFVHIEDVVNALLLAAEKTAVLGEAYNIVGEPVTQKQALDWACEFLGVRRPILHALPGFLMFSVGIMGAAQQIAGKRPKIIPEYIEALCTDRAFEIGKASLELGWEPRKQIREGIQEMVEYHKMKRKGEG